MFREIGVSCFDTPIFYGICVIKFKILLTFKKKCGIISSSDFLLNSGMSPSGKAPDFDSGIRRFKSGHPSQKSRASVRDFYFFTFHPSLFTDSAGFLARLEVIVNSEEVR